MQWKALGKVSVITAVSGEEDKAARWKILDVFDKYVWLRHVLAAIGYGLIATSLRQVSFSHWMLIAGFHFFVLLCVPYRYWLALLVGEVTSIAHLSYVCVDKYGLAWALTNLIPSLALIMPVIYLCREKWRIFPTISSLNIDSLLICSLFISVIRTLFSIGTLSITKIAPGHIIQWDVVTGRWLLGNYLGVLTTVPLMLFIRQMMLEKSWQTSSIRWTESRRLFEKVGIITAGLIVLVWLGLDMVSGSYWRQFIQIAMFLPVLWLALRHGWQGAAISGTLASVAIVLLMPEKYDPNTLKAQVILAFAISTMLLVGARIHALKLQAQKKQENEQHAFALAKQNINIGEIRANHASQALEELCDTIQAIGMRMLDRLDHSVSSADGHSQYLRQLTAVQDQLNRVADGLYPKTWYGRGLGKGLPVVLRQDSPLPCLLDECGIQYRYDLRGPLSHFPGTMHLAIYRIICEAIAMMGFHKCLSTVDIRVRCGVHHRQGWVVVRIHLHSQPPAELENIHWDKLLKHIAHMVSGQRRKAIDTYVATYGGQLNERTTLNGYNIGMSLYVNMPIYF